MFSKLKQLLAPSPQVIDRIVLVEIERPRPLVDLKKMKDGEAAIASLEGHPGWQFLMAKFKIQRAFLERTLHSEPPTDLARVGLLQQGIYWTGWLESQFSQAKAKQEKVAEPSTPLELQLFKEIQSAITKVG